MSRPYSRILRSLRRVHLTLGIICAPFLATMAVTGMVMNHKGPKFFKDVHTLKFAGPWLRVLLLDLGAVALLALATTGILLWAIPRIHRFARTGGK